jgi:hypothetical protein
VPQSHDVADAARECQALRRAAALAEWVGPSRHVTAKRVLRRAVEPGPSVTYPLCVDGRGDSPVEDWNEEFDQSAWITFDQADINTRLARLTREIAPELQDDVEVILTDTYGHTTSGLERLVRPEDMSPEPRASRRTGR